LIVVECKNRKWMKEVLDEHNIGITFPHQTIVGGKNRFIEVEHGGRGEKGDLESQLDAF